MCSLGEIEHAFERYADLLEDDASSNHDADSTISEELLYSSVLDEPEKNKANLPGNEQELTNNDQSKKNKKIALTFLIFTLCVTCLCTGTALLLTKKITVPALNIKKRIGLNRIMNFDSLINKKASFPPSSYSIYAKNTEHLKEEPVPIIVDVPGKDWLTIPTALSKCFGYKPISNGKSVSR